MAPSQCVSDKRVDNLKGIIRVTFPQCVPSLLVVIERHCHRVDKVKVILCCSILYLRMKIKLEKYVAPNALVHLLECVCHGYRI